MYSLIGKSLEKQTKMVKGQRDKQIEATEKQKEVGEKQIIGNVDKSKIFQKLINEAHSEIKVSDGVVFH